MDLAHLKGSAKSDREEKGLHGDLSQGRQNPKSISQFDEFLFYNRRFFKKKFIKWLIKLKVYFYFNKVSYCRTQSFLWS